MSNLNIFSLRHKKVVLINKNWKTDQYARKKSIKCLNDCKTNTLIIISKAHEFKGFFDFELFFFDYSLDKESTIDTQHTRKNCCKDNWYYFLAYKCF